MMADPQKSLYSVPRPSKKPKTSLPTSTTHTFTSTLSTLLASAAQTPSTQSLSRITKPAKTSLFSTQPNRPPKKRQKTDSTSQTHAESSEAVHENVLNRSKRKMEEKAKLYESMKRGEYVPRTGGRDKEVEGLVDFDRKWAEGGGSSDDDSEGEDEENKRDLEDNTEDKEEEMVEHVDEFGRTMLLPRSRALLLEKRAAAAAYATSTLSDLSARPAPPPNLIIGDTIQSAAFNPDINTSAQMEALARKRDRSLTPPEETHYDASKEVRSKGVGFYRFSGDEEGRRREMEALEGARRETEGKRERAGGEREERAREKKKKVEERRRLVREAREGRGRRDAESFLGGLDV